MDKKEEYKKLLENYRNEQDIQEFLEKNTEFIPRHFVQHHGIHHDIVFRKLALGSNYKSDFFFLSKSSDDWHCVLIEIEKPKSKFFKDSSNDFHSDFIQAQQQILNWKAWFSTKSNEESFINQFSSIRGYFHRNPSKIKYVLVMGRKEETENNEDRRAKIRSCESDNFEIMTFDSLGEGKHDPLYLCVKKNDFIEIQTEIPISDDYSIFRDIPIEWLRINTKLKTELIHQLTTHIDREIYITHDLILKKDKDTLERIKKIEVI